jgi:hypothetical protein
MMSNIDPHHGNALHKMVRSWLLAEDPYGVNNRIEPTMGAPAPTMPAPAPAPAGSTADAVAAAAPALRAQNYGRGAVQSELAKPTPQDVNSEAFQGARDPRAQAWGNQAVGRATAPSPTAEVDRTRGQAWGEDAVDKALNPPTGGTGFWAPGEAADTASAVGEQAVAGELAKKARGKVARGRLKDPQDPDDRQPD